MVPKVKKDYEKFEEIREVIWVVKGIMTYEMGSLKRFRILEV